MRFLRKVLISAAASALTLLCAVSAAALCENDYEYEIINDRAVITGYWNGSVQSLVIPETLGGKNVSEIDGYAFEFFDKMTSVTIPHTVSRIGEAAFIDCTALKDVYFTGTDRQWEAIEIETDNNCLKNASLHFNCPCVPSGLRLIGRASDALRISWDKSADADGYIVEMYKDGKWTRVSKITSADTVQYRSSCLSAGTAYKFRVRAYKMNGSEALYSDYVSISARTSPSKITGLRLAGRAGSALRFSWDENPSADGYIVEMYKDGKWVRAAKITSNKTTEFKKSGLAAGTAYKFRVKSYKMSGSVALYSGYTNISARTNPTAVNGLKIAGKAKNALRIGWEANTSADGYIIEIYKDGKWVRAGKITDNSVVSFRLSGLNAATTYKFRVKTYKMSGKTALYSGYTAISGTTSK